MSPALWAPLNGLPGGSPVAGRADLPLEEPEADEVVAARVVLVEAEVDDRVADVPRGLVGIGRRIGVDDVVLRLRLARGPEPGRRVDVVLRAAAGEDVIGAGVRLVRH